MVETTEKRDKYPIARSSKGMLAIPDTLAVQRALDVATRPDAAKYLSQTFDSRIRNAGLEKELASLNDELAQFAVQVKAIDDSRDRADIWVGDPQLPTDFEALHTALETAALDTLKKAGQAIGFTFSIDEKSNMLRAITDEDGKLIDEKTTAKVDELYLAWLSKHHMVSDSGALYHSDKKGNIKEENGKKVRVSSEEFRALMNDNKASFSSYVKSKSGGKLQIVTHDISDKKTQPQKSNETPRA